MSELYVYPEDEGMDEMVSLYYNMRLEAKYNKQREKAKEYYENNKERLVEYKKEYRKNNPDKVKESQKKWLDKNKSKMLENRKEKITCECGAVIRKDSLARHLLTPKHKIQMQILDSPHRKK